ncbi:MAG: hypothetical protein JXR42_01470 [Gammaproteobacteria bacterium]|nr:hypothetical protein [Gammaproteobacteria bacterium]
MPVLITDNRTLDNTNFSAIKDYFEMPSTVEGDGDSNVLFMNRVSHDPTAMLITGIDFPNFYFLKREAFLE